MVNRKVAYKGARWVPELRGGYPGAVDDKRDGVGFVELFTFGIGAIADDEPAPKPVRSTKLLNLHVGAWLAVRGIPLLMCWANRKFELFDWWSWCVKRVRRFTWGW
jgi:hypothetical protein